MKSVAFAVAAFAATISSVASAQTYDAYQSFDGTQGGAPGASNRFIYGTANSASPLTPGAFFAPTTGNSGCFIAGASSCLQQAYNGLDVSSLPGFTKSNTTSFQYDSVNVPADRLLAHPGDNSLQTFIAFVAPTAGDYLFKATFNILDTRPTGVGINLIETTDGALPLIFSPLAVINGTSGPGSSYTFTRRFTLGEGYAAGFGIDNQGNYFNDSTGVQFSVAAVPEPATWAMMIMGFGLVGTALRRKPRAMAPLATA